MKSSKPAIAISLLIIALGIGWLLNVLSVIKGVDWIWVTALGISGILLLGLAKLDRFNFVVGTSLIICSVLSLLRQTGKLTFNIEAPVLFISVGLLLLFSHLLRLPPASAASKENTAPIEQQPPVDPI